MVPSSGTEKPERCRSSFSAITGCRRTCWMVRGWQFKLKATQLGFGF